MISVPLWQAVALSVNIEPDTLLGSVSSRGFEDALQHEPVFRDSLGIACNHLRNGRLAAISVEANEPYSEVRLADFAAWAKSIGWSLPSELSAIGVVGSSDQPAASFAAADRQHFDEIGRMIGDGRAQSPYGAALKLANAGKLAGAGTPESKAKRVSALYRKDLLHSGGG